MKQWTLEEPSGKTYPGWFDEDFVRQNSTAEETAILLLMPVGTTYVDSQYAVWKRSA